MNIKLVRLKNGDDIISDVKQNGYLVTLKDPMRLVFRRLPTGQTMMLVAPWLPNELIEENSIDFQSSEVLGLFTPRGKLVEYYNKMVEINTERKQQFGNLLDDYLQSEIEAAEIDEEEIESELESEVSAEMMEAIEELKRTKLH